MLKEDSSAQEMTLGGEVTDLELRTQDEKYSFSNAYLSPTGTGLPSVILLANFNNETGALDTKSEDTQPDLLIKTI